MQTFAAPSAAADLLRQKGRTFAFAARWLPPAERAAVSTLYAVCRTLDDLVDECPPHEAPSVQEELDRWRSWLRAGPAAPAPRHPLTGDLARLLERHPRLTTYLLLLIDGLSSDLEMAERETSADVLRYCFQVASSVGLAMCHLLGAGDDPLARQAATQLGVAMQLTNVLRDVGADLRLGRVYVPRVELERYGYDRARLQLERVDDDFRRLMRFQLARARAYYTAGEAGIGRLPVRARMPILVAARLYAAILDEIEAADYDVFRRRAATSTRRKLLEAGHAWADLSLGRGATSGTELAVGWPAEEVACLVP